MNHKTLIIQAENRAMAASDGAPKTYALLIDLREPQPEKVIGCLIEAISQVMGISLSGLVIGERTVTQRGSKDLCVTRQSQILCYLDCEQCRRLVVVAELPLGV